MPQEIALLFDTETSGMIDWKAPLNDPRQPDIIQLAAILCTEDEVLHELNTLVNPGDINPNWAMDAGAQAVHGFSRERVEAEGRMSRDVLAEFEGLMQRADVLVCHNTAFDTKLLSIAYNRAEDTTNSLRVMNGKAYCTMKKSTNLCKLPGPYGYKWPRLTELHNFLFQEEFDNAHDALNDVRATAKCYYELRRRGL